MENVLTIVSGDDWSSVYINHNKEFSGHSIPEHVFIKLINGHMPERAESYYMIQNGQEWLEDHGDFPDNFNDIPKEYLSN
ncbi:hypothetical protein AV545_03880 [Paenibacillus jamilae]|uniref:hypothetical protein n=1 Tax=Paenibacillus jamilae TaxID=114136 RepID=UPI0007AB963D|nr:hypothetical protein [Paenibacillus jamilae]KZE65071.1 hypothetical protein AV545_03880 [Paenibacillus jamilae]